MLHGRFAALTLSVVAGLATAAGADPTAHPLRTSKPARELLAKELTPLQLQVTQDSATEEPFHNAFWNNHQAGLYVDITTNQPLFTSNEKFDSGTGWPSFWKPLVPGAVVEKRDSTHGMERVEVRSKIGDAHLGHVFDDGPKPTGLRYCINSSALQFEKKPEPAPKTAPEKK